MLLSARLSVSGGAELILAKHPWMHNPSWGVTALSQRPEYI
jgi:hypothetical protein